VTADDLVTGTDVRANGVNPAAAAAREADAHLVARICERDQAALEAIYGRYARPAYSLARRICADDSIAQDVVQEVFITLWRNSSRFDPARGSFVTWLLTVVHHRAVDAVRREALLRRRTVPGLDDADDQPPDPGPGTDQIAIAGVEAGHVREALRKLPADQCRALALAYFGGYTQREIAEITGVPLGTVKSRMFAGVHRLRALLAPMFSTAGDVRP
jgi:RNA polymerase sigma-70 factor (ECF subfamily)